MKSDGEIKQWIDSKAVLTYNELSRFIYGYKGGTPNIVNKYWGYVLQTKKWDKIKEYQTSKINNGQLNVNRFEKIKEIMKTDKRIREAGCKTGSKLLKTLYDITIAPYQFNQYKRKIC